MQTFTIRAALLGIAMCCLSTALAAQQPTTAQAQAALQNPEVVAQIRARLLSSGLPPDQVRARLRAAGYPENLLDAYLPGATASPDAAGSQAAADALRRIGILEAQAQDAQRPVGPVADTERSPIFGLDIFRGGTTRFDPLTAGVVDASYKLGPRDVLAVILTGGVEASYTLDVTGEGFVVVPQVGQVSVANLTLDQVRSVLLGRLRRVYSTIGTGPDAPTRLSVSVARVRANQVFVIGEAASPGSYQVSSAGTMLTALYAAGGPSANGSLRAVELRRGGQLVGTLDLYDYLIRGDASRDLRLESGDVLFIGFHGKRATIRGEVGRPSIFELREDETLRDLVRYAGGFTPTAANHRIQIRRVLAPSARTQPGFERVVLDVGADQLVNGSVPAFPIVSGDVVTVFGVTGVERNAITVAGHVWAPGELGGRPGMRLSEALRAAGGVRPGVHLEQVLVLRPRVGDVPLQLRTSLADSTGRPVNDMVLLEGDNVRVFSRAEFSEERTVGIAGAVRSGRAIVFREGMTLRDAVLLAGGLTEAAYLREAEIARVTTTANGSRAETFRVPLDSTYLFERGPDGRYFGAPGVQVPQGRTAEVLLRPYDQILILRQPGWDVSRRVEITGEVRFPGVYTLRSREERLTDLIERAGGFTTEGYPLGTAFVRKADNLGRIDINVVTAMKNPEARDNLVLRDGDAVHVPRFSPVVRVSGAVSSPASVAWVPGKDLNYYIDAAGGLLDNGNRSRAYVVQPNGTREVYRNNVSIVPDRVPTPEAGAEIVVPSKPDRPERDWTSILGPVTQALTALVTLIYVITR